jgi:mannose-6-phosphate isomerase-like protein (cupin superfamily)
MKNPLVHLHPNAIETYEVLESEMEFFFKDKWLAAKKGDKLTVPKGTTHAFRNPTEKIVTVFNTHQPAP